MARRARRTRKPTHDDPRSLRALLVRHLEWMRVQNYAPLTVKTRDFDMRRFFTWCDERGIATAVEITPSVIEDYKRHLFHRKKKDGKPLSRKTQLHLLVSLLGFTKWLLKRGLVLTDPGALIELPQIDRRLPHPALTIEEVEQVLGAIDVTQPLGLRDRTILEMAYSTGMRRIELAHACLEDVDAERGTVYVRRGKGNKDRVVPIGARALSWLDKYLEEVRPFFARDDEVREIFVSRFGTPMTEEALSAVGLKRRRRAGLDKPGSLHIYRHSAATGMLEGGADIRVIQEYLGHAYLTSTQVYTKVAIQTVKAVHARTHPAERPKVEPDDPADSGEE
jgi:integrase/recombinase XerD